LPMHPYLDILRPHNCFMAGVAVMAGVAIASGDPSSATSLLAFAVAFVVCGAGNIINDYYDYEIDRINNPLRPLPSGRMSLHAAHTYALALFILGTALAFIISLAAFLLAAFNSSLLYLYASSIKRKGGAAKNLVVSYLVASPFLFGGLVAERPLSTILLAGLAGLANTSREIIKDIQDYEGDMAFVETLPAKIGIQGSARLASGILVLAIAMSPLPYILGLVSSYYLYMVLSADALFLLAIPGFLRSPRERAASAQRLLKLGMALALGAFLAGSLL
jgi:geranylgeranylglycerol-phosphate geranylgeranyltransferase